jgi:hypothetical protein
MSNQVTVNAHWLADLQRDNERLQAELTALSSIVRHERVSEIECRLADARRSVLATEQKLREVTAERDRLLKGLEKVCTYECLDSWHGPCGNCAYCAAAEVLEPTQ